MICSSVKRFFMSNLLRVGLDSKPMCYSNAGDVGSMGDALQNADRGRRNEKPTPEGGLVGAQRGLQTLPTHDQNGP